MAKMLVLIVTGREMEEKRESWQHSQILEMPRMADDR
jgi:hypothetical protein